MSKTADLPVRWKKPFPAVAFFILASCLLVHFLAEDAVFYSTSPSFGEAGTAHPLSFDEAEHLDDLVMLGSLPEYAITHEFPAAFSLPILSTRQVNFPILTPPKIS